MADALTDCVLEVFGVLPVHVDTLGAAVVIPNTIAVTAAWGHHTIEGLTVVWHVDNVRVRVDVTILLPWCKPARVPS